MPARLAPVTDQARPRPLLLLVDGHSMAYRAFFALPAENFSTRTGQTTNAVYGFTSMLANLLRDEQPTHVAVAFDAGRVTFRTEEYPQYKGTRDETPQEFRGQVPLIREILDSLCITTLQKEGFEADDIIATLATQAQEAGMDVLVCTGDRDALQLVADDVTVLYPRKGVSDLVRFTPEGVREKYGVPPAAYPDLAALVGESSDNLPGVPGVGPKTAAKWITAYGGLDGVLAAATSITGKAGENLRACLDQVRLNRRLNGAVRDVELPVGAVDLAVRPWDREAMHRVFDALEFRTLRERLFAMVPEDVVEAEGFRLDVVVPAPGALGAWLEERRGRRLALEVAGTAGPGRGDAWALAVADGADHAVVVDLPELGPDDEAALARWLADPDATKAVHGAKEAWHALAGRGLVLAGVVVDTLLASYLCHPDQRSYDLGDLS
ncbi:MAG: DNA polymerase I, partial [Actinotalea sp.]|nr:DNA polymerase I [Actinotalea sp.]